MILPVQVTLDGVQNLIVALLEEGGKVSESNELRCFGNFVDPKVTPEYPVSQIVLIGTHVCYMMYMPSSSSIDDMSMMRCFGRNDHVQLGNGFT